MRQYEPIWHAIKTKNHASIVAPVERHKRIIKAVTKEKHRDEGYKLLLADRCLKATLVISVDVTNKNLITFSLSMKIIPAYIGVHDL